MPLPLQPHQQRVVDRIARSGQSGLVVAHGLGSGKSLASIAALTRLGLPTDVVLPAALRGNYTKELHKWLGGVPPDTEIHSQQGLARGGPNDLRDGLLIVDEAHRARSSNSALLQQLRQTQHRKKLLLSASPLYNTPRDLAPLVNIAAGKRMLPEDPNEFDKRYVRYKQIQPALLQRLMGVKPGLVPELQNVPELRKILRSYVDYHPNSEEGFPSSTEETINVPLSKQQTEIYQTIMGKAPWWLRMKVKSGLPPGKGELEAMRAFLSGARQVSNTSRGFVRRKSDEKASKIQAAFNSFHAKAKADPTFKGLVYSNYLDSGLGPYKELLNNAQIPFGEFSGDVSPQVRNKMVQDFNANKLRALLISSAGAEGLDLKGTRLVQLLEPHFNEEKEKQIIGRAIRYQSHAALPEDKRHVQVQRFIGRPEGSWLDRLLGKPTVHGADEYIRNIALQKSKLNNQFVNVLAGLNT